MGGSALVAKIKGEKNMVRARQIFTLLTLVTLISSLIISTIAFFLRYQILWLLGARNIAPIYLELAMDYMIPIIWGMPVMILGTFFVQFLIADGRPGISLAASGIGSLITIGLSALLIFTFDLGAMGLALATGLGFLLPTLFGVGYFIWNRRGKGALYFVKPIWDIRAIGRSSLNGLSEAVGQLAFAVTTILMNNILTNIEAVGPTGVGAAGIVFSLQMLFGSFFFGYSMGVAPLISYNYGKENHTRIKQLFKKSLIIVAGLSVVTVGTSIALARPITNLMVQEYMWIEGFYYHYYGTWVWIEVGVYQSMQYMRDMAVRGMYIVSTAFIVMGFNLFASGLFTALNDGVVSTLMVIARTFLFLMVLLLTLPRAMGIDGAWTAIPLAELLAFIVSAVLVFWFGKKYRYLGGFDK